MAEAVETFKCPHCESQMTPDGEPNTFECEGCRRRIRRSVLCRKERFQRVAEGDGRLATLARLALEGER